jgi:hypothetical protein
MDGGNEYTITVLHKVQKCKCVKYGIFLIFSYFILFLHHFLNRSKQAFSSLFNKLRSFF